MHAYRSILDSGSRTPSDSQFRLACVAARNCSLCPLTASTAVRIASAAEVGAASASKPHPIGPS
eukprot:3787127-Pyramimonas_sp.AAC.1